MTLRELKLVIGIDESSVPVVLDCGMRDTSCRNQKAPRRRIDVASSMKQS